MSRAVRKYTPRRPAPPDPSVSDYETLRVRRRCAQRALLESGDWADRSDRGLRFAEQTREAYHVVGDPKTRIRAELDVRLKHVEAYGLTDRYEELCARAGVAPWNQKATKKRPRRPAQKARNTDVD